MTFDSFSPKDLITMMNCKKLQLHTKQPNIKKKKKIQHSSASDVRSRFIQCTSKGCYFCADCMQAKTIK